MEDILSLIAQYGPVGGGAIIVLAALKIVLRHMELRFEEKEKERQHHLSLGKLEDTAFNERFSSLFATSAEQLKSLQELLSFQQRQYAQASLLQSQLITGLTKEKIRLEQLVISCPRCIALYQISAPPNEELPE